MSSKLLNYALGAIVCAGVCLLQAQQMPSATSLVPSPLQMLAKSAGIVFTGTVIAVQRLPARTDSELDTVQITFRVTHALRGAHAGRELTIREWMGLWAAGEQYRVGERVLLFLYPASRLGLTSPVAGRQGRFSVDDQDRVIVDRELLRELTSPGQQTAISVVSGQSRINYREMFRAIARGSGE